MNEGIEHIVDDSISSQNLCSRMLSTHIWYIQLTKLCPKKDDLLSLLESLSMDNSSEKNLGISHLDSFVLYSLQCNEVELMIGAADYFINNLTKSTTFHVEPL